MGEFKQSVRSRCEEFFSSGWLFFVPLTIFYVLAKVFQVELPIVVRSIQIYIGCCLIGALWHAVPRVKAVGIVDYVFPLSIGGLLLMVGPDLQFSSDSWSLWGRPRAALSITEFRGLGELLNECLYRMLHFLPWKLDAKIVGFAWGALICFQSSRFFSAIGLAGAWKRAAIVGIFLFYGPIGLPYFATYILGVSAMAMVAQLAFFIELIRLCGTWKTSRVLMLLCLLLVAAVNHLQSVIMMLMGISAVVSWLLVNRFGWFRYGIGVVVLGIFGAVFYEFIFLTGSRINVIEELSDEGWIGPAGIANIFKNDGEAQAYLGMIGVVDVIAGAYLVFRKKLVGWFTLLPGLALLYPPFVGMFYWMLSEYNSIYVVNRIFLLTPPFLSLLFVAQMLSCGSREGWRKKLVPVGVCVIALLSIIPVWPVNGKVGFIITGYQGHFSLEQCRELINWIEKGKLVDKGDIVFADTATQHAVYSKFGTELINPGRDQFGRMGDLTLDNFEEVLNQKEINVAILINRQNVVTPRPPLVNRLHQHTPPLLLKHDWTYDPKTTETFERLTKSGEWRKEVIPPFFNVYVRKAITTGELR